MPRCLPPLTGEDLNPISQILPGEHVNICKQVSLSVCVCVCVHLNQGQKAFRCYERVCSHDWICWPIHHKLKYCGKIKIHHWAFFFIDREHISQFFKGIKKNLTFALLPQSYTTTPQNTYNGLTWSPISVEAL